MDKHYHKELVSSAKIYQFSRLSVTTFRIIIKQPKKKPLSIAQTQKIY